MNDQSNQVWDLLKRLSETQEKRNDPSLINDYKSALKFVVNKTSQDENVMQEIKRLVEDQKKHENQWGYARQELIKKQQTREQGQEQVTKLFAMIGAESKPSENTDETRVKELQNYDLKVYRWMVDMANRQRQVLCDLRVPLFCMRNDLQRPDTLAHDRQKLLDVLYNLAS